MSGKIPALCQQFRCHSRQHQPVALLLEHVKWFSSHRSDISRGENFFECSFLSYSPPLVAH